MNPIMHALTGWAVVAGLAVLLAGTSGCGWGDPAPAPTADQALRDYQREVDRADWLEFSEPEHVEEYEFGPDEYRHVIRTTYTYRDEETLPGHSRVVYYALTYRLEDDEDWVLKKVTRHAYRPGRQRRTPQHEAVESMSRRIALMLTVPSLALLALIAILAFARHRMKRRRDRSSGPEEYDVGSREG